MRRRPDVFFFKRTTGEIGERIARKHCRKRGWRILKKNYTCHLGEIDLIADDGDAIVFIEVKTRTADSGEPHDNIRSNKRRHIERVAQYWLRANGNPERAYRFDVIAVLLRPGATPQIDHIEEAFLPRHGTG